MGELVDLNLLPHIQSYLSFGYLSSFNTGLIFSVLTILISLLLLALFLRLTIYLYLLKKQIEKEYVILEVKPLKETLQSSFSTQQLFTYVHSLLRQQNFLEKLTDFHKSYSFELVSTKKEGIRYLMRVDREDSQLIRKSLLSYLPGISIQESEDYLTPSLLNKIKNIILFKQSNHFAYPLKEQKTLSEYDSIAYLTGSMTKLKEDELVSFQVVVSPAGRSTKKAVKRIKKLIAKQNDLLREINERSKYGLTIKYFLTVAIYLLTIPIGFVVFLISGGEEGPLLNLSLNNSKRSTGAYQKELETNVKNKLDQELFTTSLRLLVIGETNQRSIERIKGIYSALSSFSNSYQSIIRPNKLNKYLLTKLKVSLFKNRLSLFGKSVFSISEISDIYHFPFTSTTKTEDLQKQHSKTLPAPLSLKKEDNLDVVFAENIYGDEKVKIGLTKEERRRHVYILGATGTGKTTMLESMIENDLVNDKGVCVIDPHGDLIEDILHLIPEKRLKDVVYFNPDDIGYPIGINLLELSKGLSKDDSLREKEYITESVISLFHKIYTEKYSGPRMEYILRNTIHTAFTVEGANLFTVHKLLINSKYRKKIVKNLEDENLKDFWKYEFAKAGDYQKIKMISPITNKIGRFLFSPTAKRILEQEKSTIDFEKIINEGKILLCNLSKGKIGEDNSEVFGVVVMAKLQLAALKRARIPMQDRKDFYLYVDEFQNFATPAFAQIMSEARKYRLNATLAHQTTSQLEDRALANVTLANTGTVICFRTANPEDEKLILPQFTPYIQKGEIASLPSFNFYMRLAAINPEEPFSGLTTPVDVRENEELINSIIRSSRKRYAIKYKEPEKTKQKSKPKKKNKSKRARLKRTPALP